MTRIQRLTERAITFALAEPNEQLAVTQLAFLARGDRTLVCPLARHRVPGPHALPRPATSLIR